jgi:hypothetical protein
LPHALAHATQSNTVYADTILPALAEAGARMSAFALVGDFHNKSVVIQRQVDSRGCTTGVAVHVSERLLQDAKNS